MARFVSDVSIFDGTQMAPGTKFTKIWRIKNVGETPWPSGTKMLFVGGDRMMAELSVPIGPDSKTVMPGEEVDVAVDMIAPTELGRYLGYWRLVGPHGRRRFGQRVWCHVQVVDPTGSEHPHDPSVVEAEISHLMERVSAHDDDDNEDGEADGAPEPAPSAPTAANLSATAACAAPSATTEPCAASSVASSSSITSSAVSVQTDKAVPVSEAPAIPQPPTADPAVPEPAAPKVATADDEPKSESDVATELMKMGFEPKSVELVLEKNGNAASPAALLEACTGDLVQLSEWDSMLSDLEEMGFENRDLNKRLMVKNNGSVKRTVKDLVADAN